MRQVVLDTETTGIDPASGHRIIEIGCVELLDRELTGRHFHTYCNPQRDVEEGAFRVHGLNQAFLQDKPLFSQIVEPMIEYIDNAELIIHNAPFDLSFLDAELKRLRWPQRMADYCTVLDTLVLSRQKHPGQRNNLDALCKRYEIDNSKRQFHGALLDAEILAAVYLAMTGGQVSLFEETHKHSDVSLDGGLQVKPRPVLSAKTPVIPVSNEELAAHEAFMQWIIKKSGVNRQEQ